MDDGRRLTLPPRDIAQLRSMIVSRTIVMPDTYRSVLEVGFADPEIIAYGNARSIATRCGIAASTVWRIAGFLGFQSFREFKKLFRDQLVERAERVLTKS